MTTRVYEGKKALFDRLAVLTATGQPLDGIQVAYAFPGDPQLECVYGGGVRFSHEDAVAERGVLVTEVALVSVYIRVARKPAVPVEETDTRAAEIFAQLAVQLTGNPYLAGQLMFAGITQGQGDYEVLPDGSQSTSILGVQARIETDLTYGAA